MNAKSQLFYSINEDKEKSLFKNAYIFFDTSSLLDFYYYSESTKNEIFKKLFVSLKKRLWIAAQTEYEFLKNREKVFLKPIDSYDAIQKKAKGQKDGGHIDEIDNIIKGVINVLRNDLSGQLKTFKEKTGKNDKHPYLEDVPFEDFEAKNRLLEAYLVKYYAGFIEFKEEVEKRISSQKELLESALVKDAVLEEFQKSFQTTEGTSYAEVLQIVEEGEIRYRNDIPPGYMDDDNKVGFQKYGDLILWKQIIKKSKEDKKDVILVINDMKEDWWYYPEKDKPASPRHELIKELFDAAGQTFWMYNISDFLFKSRKIIDLSIKEDVIQDVKNVIQPSRILDNNSVVKWLVAYFGASASSVEFYDAVDNYAIDYSYVSSAGDKIGFIHKFISNARYTGVYLPLRAAFDYIGYAKARMNLDKMYLVIECASYDAGALLLKHMGRKNPKGILDLSKGVFRVLIVTNEDNGIEIVYDSDDYSIV